MKIIKFDTLTSTNTYLLDNYEKYDNLTIVTSNHQTSGKGRLGRTWIDQDDLLFSILIKNNLEKATDYSLLIASSIIKVLKSQKYNLSPLVKWPNDIIVNNKKLAGILLEAKTKEKIECVVIGVGINTNSIVFLDDLRVKATSLKLELKKEINKEELLSDIQEVFEKDYLSYINNQNDYLTIIRSNFYLQDKEVNFIYNSINYKGIVKGITNNGKLIVNTDKEVLEINTGEITLHNTYE